VLKEWIPAWAPSFTAIAFVGMMLVTRVAVKDNYRDSNEMETNVKHSRQDLRLIAYLLAAILVMLGIIADRIH
jgi:archaellum biogenesis protein FlaJ (TadC family)